MAVDPSRKRKRAHVSYREPSSDDDLSNSDSDNPARKKPPVRRSTRHQSQQLDPEPEPSTSHPAHTHASSPASARSAAHRTRRRKGKRRISYREESTDDDDGEDDGNADYEPHVVEVQRKPRSKQPSRRSTPRQQLQTASNKTRGYKKRAFGAPLEENKGTYTP